MEQKNYIRQPVLIVGLTVVFLAALSMLPSAVQTAGNLFRSVDLFSDIRRAPDTILVQQKAIRKHRRRESVGIVDYGLQPGGSMSTFYRSLRKHGSRSRIAYYGDSMIEGDLITMDVRDALQSRFGGHGVGFLPIASIAAGFRSTVRHSFSDDWKSVSLLDPPGERWLLGSSGFGFVPRLHSDSVADAEKPPASWVEYKPIGRSGLDRLRIFYGPVRNHGAVRWFSDRKNGTLDLSSGSGAHQISVPVERGSRIVRFEFSADDSLSIYGVSIESDSGVFVDNYSLRGNSGVPLSMIPSASLRGLGQFLEYKLIVLQFGANVANPEKRGYDWYRRSMIRVVEYFQHTCPEAAILMIGVGDKAKKEGINVMTDPCIFPLIEVQRSVAKETHAAFWDLFEAMGGENTMAQWVSARPPLGQPDYTHVTGVGASKIANLLSAALLDGYRKYQKGPK